jgi:hypothetical protein
MQSGLGVSLNRGKPITSEKRTATGTVEPGLTEASGRNRSLRNTALQQGLRAAYRTVVEEPLPDRLLSLLQQLDGDGPKR